MLTYTKSFNFFCLIKSVISVLDFISSPSCVIYIDLRYILTQLHEYMLPIKREFLRKFMAHWHYSTLFCTLYLRNGVISLLSFLAILELFWHSSKTLLRHSSEIVPHPTPLIYAFAYCLREFFTSIISAVSS